MVKYESSITKESSFDKSGFLSKLFFCWLTRFFVEFQNKPLKVKDLEKCPRYDESERIGGKLAVNWNHEVRASKLEKQSSLGMAIIKTFGKHYSPNFFLLTISALAQILQTVCMGTMIDDLYLLSKVSASQENLSTSKDPAEENIQPIKQRIYLSACGLVVTQIIYTYFSNLYWFLARKCGIAVRVACSRLIYHKSLALSHRALGETTPGQIVNLLTNDVGRFDYASEFPFFLIVGPMQIAICLAILWPLLGISSIIGLLILFLYIPLQTFMGKAFSKLRTEGAERTDERVRLMNEFLPAMRVIKMYAWEQPLAGLVGRARQREVSKIRSAAYLRGVNYGLSNIAEKAIMFLMLVSFILMGNRLTAKTVFVSMSLVRQLQLSITLFIPLGISTGAESLISIKRIRKFLLLPEQESNQADIGKSLGILGDSGAKQSRVTFSHVYVSWKETCDPGKACLNDITFDIVRGQLLAVVGPVGAGKSSLIMTILGEIAPKSGKIEILGKVSYASQQAWIFAGTVRENILFNSQYEETRYKRVIHVAALERDLELLPLGDETIVGDRGTSLSGGQRSRINLARCLYAKSDIYLLDDPLSAVDAPVAKHIFEKSIKTFLADKITILVTHQLQFIKSADRILLIKNGVQVCFGDYTEFLKKGSDFIKYSTMLESEAVHQKSQSPGSPDILLSTPGKLSGTGSLVSLIPTPEVSGSRMSITEILSDPVPFKPTDPGDVMLAVVGDEEDSGLKEIKGLEANKHLLWTYITSGISALLFPFWACYLVGPQFLSSFIEYYFSLWADSEERKSNYNPQVGNTSLNQMAPVGGQNFVDNLSRDENIYLFSGLTLGILVWFITENLAFFAVCMRSSINLHDKLFRALLRAPISFFDNNPIGIVLNRISRDMGIIDDFLPNTLSDTVFIFSACFASLLVMAIIQPYLVISSVLLFTLCVLVRSRYVGIARDVKRLEGITKSPVFSHLAATLDGLATIRAFRVQERFKAIFDVYQDEHTSAYFTWIASSRFFISAINNISVVFTLLIVVTVLLALDSLPGSSVGLIITATIGIAGMIQWGMRQWTEVETMMTSVERISELHHVPPEGDLEAPKNSKPPESWPDRGQIIFSHVSLSYDPAKPPVLNDLNFKIEPREKVGIVGRTGAGKSSIMAALFRMTEPEGNIVIDGIDIGTIGLHDLRRKISIIPQEPVIFSGTIRYNLDPFNSKKDSDIWHALDQVQLKKPVDEMGGLEAILHDGGSNLSVGQRQLVCLARAILANNKILVLDEATANIDPTTDELIQQTIRSQFVDCTVLTIAHRLQTIMDSDKILVMDAGKVAQFGDPGSLIENKEGLFYSMVQATGSETAENLIKIASKNQFNLKKLK